MDYTRTSLADVQAGLRSIAVDTRRTFGALDERQLNWRPDDTRWSAAQCLQHLVTTNDLMVQGADRALDQSVPRTLWQRLPLAPGILGRMLIRSQAPTATRKYVAPAPARPSTTGISSDIVDRFVSQHDNLVRRLDTLDEREAAQTIMVSPFVRVVAYTVLDGWRLIYAHDLRHLQQARAVLEQAGVDAGRG